MPPKRTDKRLQVYFDKNRNRVDPAVCVNVVRLFYHHGRGDDPALQLTKRWIYDVLLHRAFRGGTRYYNTPEAFLYFVGRLLNENPGVVDDLLPLIGPLLQERLRELLNSEGDTLALGMRILACYHAGMASDEPAVAADIQQLLGRQQEDGSFGIGWLCRYGRTGTRIGSRALTAALAISAIESFGVNRKPTTSSGSCQ